MASTSVHVTRLVFFMLAIVLLGVPLVSYLWGTLNLVLAWQAPVGRVVVSLGALALFLLLLWVLGRHVYTMESPAQKGDDDAG